jgi:hypothetical protein
MTQKSVEDKKYAFLMQNAFYASKEIVYKMKPPQIGLNITA